MTEGPEQQPEKAPSQDKGLLYWVDLIRKPIAAQAGVEILDPDRAPFRFRFRGQVFQVTIAAVTESLSDAGVGMNVEARRQERARLSKAWDRWYATLPADMRRKLSIHDFKRLGDCFKAAFEIDDGDLPR